MGGDRIVARVPASRAVVASGGKCDCCVLCLKIADRPTKFVTMHQRSKQPRKVPDRTLTRSDIQRMVQAIRIKKSREHSNYQEDETSDAVVSNEARYTSSGTLFDS